MTTFAIIMEYRERGHAFAPTNFAIFDAVVEDSPPVV